MSNTVMDILNATVASFEEEAITELNSMPAGGDPEILHGRADNLLCEYLEKTGQVKLATAFREAREQVGFWYA